MPTTEESADRTTLMQAEYCLSKQMSHRDHDRLLRQRSNIEECFRAGQDGAARGNDIIHNDGAFALNRADNRTHFHSLSMLTTASFMHHDQWHIEQVRILFRDFDPPCVWCHEYRIL